MMIERLKEKKKKKKIKNERGKWIGLSEKGGNKIARWPSKPG